MVLDTLPNSLDIYMVVVGCVALVIFRFVAGWHQSLKNGPFPPGPKPRWFIGNALDIAFKNASRVYYSMSKEYNSNIIGLNAFGFRLIILNSREDVDELLENRSLIYSDRPYAPVKLLGWEYNFSLLPYGEYWRAHHRLSQQCFKASSVKAFDPTFTNKVHDFLIGLLDLPDRFEDHSKMFSRAVPLSTMFGYDVKSVDDPAVYAADEHMNLGIKILSPGGSLVSLFPLFEYVPWTWTQRMAAQCRALGHDMKHITVDALLKNLEIGNATPSVVGDFMEKKQTTGASQDEEEIVMNVAQTVYAAAADTTISATQTFFYLMVKHPEIQSKAQKELDRVLGLPHRLPTFEDRASLPYIEATYRELLRWCPPVPMGVGHVAREDDWYKGYYIPKGTCIFANIWAMGLDEKQYGPNPDLFNPERFLDGDGEIKNMDRILAFGFGKRHCVGKHVASSMLWLMMASILCCFKLCRKKDQNGLEVEVDDTMNEEGIMIHKAPFECDIRPRSDKWGELLEASRRQV